LEIKPDGRREISSFRMATLCITYSRDSLNKVRVKDSVLIAEDLRRIYRAKSEESAKEDKLRLRGKIGVGYILR
jgi:transposase-like protein